MLSEIGLDAAVVANHEFDNGARNLAAQYGGLWWLSTLPQTTTLKIGTYLGPHELEKMVEPSSMFELDGLRGWRYWSRKRLFSQLYL